MTTDLRFEQRQRHTSDFRSSSGVYQDAIKLIEDVKLAVNVVCQARTAAVVHRGGARAGTRDTARCHHSRVLHGTSSRSRQPAANGASGAINRR